MLIPGQQEKIIHARGWRSCQSSHITGGVRYHKGEGEMSVVEKSEAGAETESQRASAVLLCFSIPIFK
jgi:hypothetical protein